MPATAPRDRVPKSRSERLNVRVTREQARLIRMAAKETKITVSGFLVESACLRAEEALASQRQIVYDTQQWEAFMAMLDRPAQDKPRLRKLLTEPSILEQRDAAR